MWTIKAKLEDKKKRCGCIRTAFLLPTDFVCVSSAFFRWSATLSDAAPDAIYRYVHQTRPAARLNRLASPPAVDPGKFFGLIFLHLVSSCILHHHIISITRRRIADLHGTGCCLSAKPRLF
ncbi:hypothetical protein ISCGN_031519 [Ixodes scapularis]